MLKNESLSLKGVAIMLMFWHHLFGCGEFLIEKTNVWYPIFGQFDSIIGICAKICIGLFAFVSGYGLHVSYISNQNSSRIINRILRFLIIYWTMLFFIAIPYLIYTGKFEVQHLLINLFALLHNDEMLYLSFSWYVKFYLEALLVTPLIKKISHKINSVSWEIGLFVLFPLLLSQFITDAETTFISVEVNILSSIQLLFTWYPILHIGMVFAKYRLFTKIDCFLNNLQTRNKLQKFILSIFITSILFAALLIRHVRLFSFYTEIISVTIFVVCFHILYTLILYRYDSFLMFLGKYSFNYWLISGMFFLNTIELQPIIMFPKISILIFIWSFLLLTPIAMLMNWISQKLIQYFKIS